MPEFRIAVYLDHLLPADTPVNRDFLPNLAHAVERIAQAAHAQWLAYANQTPLPDGRVIHTRTGTYLRSIQLRETGDFAQEVYSDAPHARALEEGMPERDLKAMLGTSHKVRISKSGARYLIIPFRWNIPGQAAITPNVMPEVVHALVSDARRFAPSRIVGSARRTVGHRIADRTPLKVTERTYVWGDRLRRSDLAGMGVTGQHARRLTGLVHFQRQEGRGGGKHGQYLTFRIMSDKSPPGSWIAPRVEGFYPARTVADQLRPVAERAFTAAVQADVQRFIGGAAG